MENEHALKDLVRILSFKGYTDSFQTNAVYPDDLEESIERYLRACKEGQDRLTENLSLQCYLKYNGEDQPFVHCSMTVWNRNEKFSVSEMKISKYHAPGILEREAVLKIESPDRIPDKAKAVAMVDEPRFKKRLCFRR